MKWNKWTRRSWVKALTWLVLLELREWPCSMPLFAVDRDDCCVWIPVPVSCCSDKWLFVDVIESDNSVFGGSDDSDIPESVTLEDTIDDMPSIFKNNDNDLLNKLLQFMSALFNVNINTNGMEIFHVITKARLSVSFLLELVKIETNCFQTEYLDRNLTFILFLW